MARRKKMTDRQFALAAAKLATDRNCTDVKVLDLRGLSPVTDYFVLATGTSSRQGQSVIDEICADAEKIGLRPFGQAGYETGRWILVDFVNVVIHIFDAEYRQYYDLEMLWGDAKKLKIK